MRNPFLWAVFSFLLILCGAEKVFADGTYNFGQIKVGQSDAFLVTDSPDQQAGLRAVSINRTIADILADGHRNPDHIDIRVMKDGHPAVALDDIVILETCPADAQIFGASESELAMRWSSILRDKMLHAEASASSSESNKASAGSVGKPLSERRIFLFLIQISLLLIFACVFGEIFARWGQPAVIGQLTAGIFLGPSVFGALFPDFYRQIFPDENTQGYLLDIVSWLGTIFLLMLTGTETDLNLIKAQGKSAFATATGGMVLAFACGIGTAFIIPQEMLVLPTQRLILGVFLGTVFSVSSVTIIAKVLMDMKLLRRNVGQGILASALIQDVFGCILLALVAALAAKGGCNQMDLIKVPVGMLLFVGFGATIGRKVVLNLLRWVHDRSRIEYASISLVVILLLLSAAITQAIGVHVVLGSFALGVLIAQSPLVGEKILHPLEAVTFGIFAPIFFAAAGLHINLTLLKDPALMIMMVVITVAACLGKIGGSLIGGRLVKMGLWESLSVGFGTNARGTMGLIVGILGFSLGILTVNMFTIIVIMSLFTTAIAPPLLSYALKHVPLDPQEQDRLRREERQSKSFVTKIRRVLLPIKEGSGRQLSARLLKALGQHHPLEATSLTVLSPDTDMENYFSKTLSASSKEGNVTLVNRSLQGDPAEEILKESSLNYDLVVLECESLPDDSSVFGSVIDSVAKKCPCPLLIVRESTKSDDWNLRRILIPTTGLGHTAKAAELGIMIARATSAQVTTLYVEENDNDSNSFSFKSLSEDDARSDTRASDIVEQVSALASAFGVDVDVMVSRSVNAAEEIIRVANLTGADLIVLGASVRPTRRLFLGSTIKDLIKQANCHVAVLSP